MAIENPLWNKLRTGEIDANEQQLFFSILLKGLVYNLNNTINVRNIAVPHYILNTGDDIMYLEVKGQNQAIEPREVSNEEFVYNTIPRCMVQPSGMNIPTDQLTNPYTTGSFEFEYDDTIYTFIAEYRRMPIKFNVSLKYVFDNYTDALQCTQQLITKLAFINPFKIIYLGQTIDCSYNIPADYNTEFMMEFDGLSEDDKTRKLNLDIEVDTNLPVIYPRTLMPADSYIKNTIAEHNFFNKGVLTEKHNHTYI